MKRIQLEKTEIEDAIRLYMGVAHMIEPNQIEEICLYTFFYRGKDSDKNAIFATVHYDE